MNRPKTRFLIFIAIAVFVLPQFALTTSYLSRAITVGEDTSHIDIDGIILHKGFPVWFVESFKDIGMTCWRHTRFIANSAIWIVIWTTAAIAVYRLQTRRKQV